MRQCSYDESDEGGYDNKYRKVRGIGVYQKKQKCENQDASGVYHRRVNGIEQENKTSTWLIVREQQTDNGEYIHNVNKFQYSQERYQFFLDAPFEISNMCCNVMKKEPAHRYFRKTGRKPITAQMASESRLRTQQWINNGCNGFDLKIPTSNPMSFWTEQDVLLYIREYGNRMANNPWRIKPKSEEVMKYGKRIVYRSTGGTAPYYPKEYGAICSVYGDVVVDYCSMKQCDNQMSLSDYGIFDEEMPLLKTTGCKRTGCVLCGFGCHLEKEPNRFQMLKETHPKFYNLLFILKNNGITYAEAIDWINKYGNMNIKY